MSSQKYKLIATIKTEPYDWKCHNAPPTEKRRREEEELKTPKIKKRKHGEKTTPITSFRTPSEKMNTALQRPKHYLGEEPSNPDDHTYVPSIKELRDWGRTQQSNKNLGTKKPALGATVIHRKKTKTGTITIYLGKANTKETEPFNPRKCYSTHAYTPIKHGDYQYRRVAGLNLSLIDKGTTARGSYPLTVSKEVPGFYDHSKLHGAPINTYMVQAHLIANSLGIPQQDTELLVPTSQKYNRDEMGRVEQKFFSLAQQLGKIEKLEVNLTQVDPLSENGLAFFREAGVKFVKNNSFGIEDYDERIERYCNIIIRHLDGLWEQIATGSFWPVTRFEMSTPGIKRAAGKDLDWGIPHLWTKGRKGTYKLTQDTPRPEQDKHLRHPTKTPGLLASTKKTAQLKSRLFTGIPPGLSKIRRSNFLERYKTTLFYEIRKYFTEEPPKELHISRSMSHYLQTLKEEKEDPLLHTKPQHRLSFSGNEKISKTPTKPGQRTPAF